MLLRSNAKTRISGFPDGLVKLVFRVSDKVLLGVHIVGELASELIHIGQFVIQAGRYDRPLHRRHLCRPHTQRGVQVRGLRWADVRRSPHWAGSAAS